MSDGDSGSAANAKTEKTEPGALVAECPLAPTSAIHDRAFGLQKACKRTSERRVAREKSLQIAGGRTWIRTRTSSLSGRLNSLPI